MTESLKSSGLIDTIHNVDCMVGMKNIPDGSIDLILCDLPFGVSANKWDSILPLDKLFDEYKRIVKRGGGYRIIRYNEIRRAAHKRLSRMVQI